MDYDNIYIYIIWFMYIIIYVYIIHMYICTYYIYTYILCSIIPYHQPTEVWSLETTSWLLKILRQVTPLVYHPPRTPRGQDPAVSCSPCGDQNGGITAPIWRFPKVRGTPKCQNNPLIDGIVQYKFIQLLGYQPLGNPHLDRKSLRFTQPPHLRKCQRATPLLQSCRYVDSTHFYTLPSMASTARKSHSKWPSGPACNCGERCTMNSSNTPALRATAMIPNDFAWQLAAAHLPARLGNSEPVTREIAGIKWPRPHGKAGWLRFL